MTKFLPPYEPVDILCLASLILCQLFSPYSHLLTLYILMSDYLLKVSLNVTFYLGKDRKLGKELKKKYLQF